MVATNVKKIYAEMKKSKQVFVFTYEFSKMLTVLFTFSDSQILQQIGSFLFHRHIHM